jgi:hypothetical protein
MIYFSNHFWFPEVDTFNPGISNLEKSLPKKILLSPVEVYRVTADNRSKLKFKRQRRSSGTMALKVRIFLWFLSHHLWLSLKTWKREGKPNLRQESRNNGHEERDDGEKKLTLR